MSQWTHVAGTVRIDYLEGFTRCPSGVFNDELEQRFGNTVTFYDPQEKWAKVSVPVGSEGSVQYKILETRQSESELAWGLVCIWGDLRDYDNHQEIFEWLRKACKGLMVRSCCVKIDIEFKGSYLVYDIANSETDETDLAIKSVLSVPK